MSEGNKKDFQKFEKEKEFEKEKKSNVKKQKHEDDFAKMFRPTFSSNNPNVSWRDLYLP